MIYDRKIYIVGETILYMNKLVIVLALAILSFAMFGCTEQRTVIVADANGGSSSLVDTNWQTSFGTFDANMKATYALLGGTDTNWQTSWSVFDANMKTTYKLPWSDTNTFTKCGDNNQFLLGSGFCIPYVAGATYKPTSVLKVSGTDFNNVALNAIKEYDNNYYTIREVSGANPLTIDVNFTGVTSFSSIIIKEQYTGGSGHEIVVEIFKYSTGTWDTYFEITDQAAPVTTYIPIEDSTDHTSGNLVQLRFRHVNNGNTSHYFYVDYVWLQSGTTTSTSNLHDALSGRDRQSNHPWALSKIDANGFFELKGAITDTNWQTSWGTLDANLKATYITSYIDTNWKTSWTVFDANLAATYRLYSVDLNTSSRIQADKNVLIGPKGYIYDDGNSIIIGRSA